MSNDNVSTSKLLVGWVESINANVTFYDVLAVLGERGFAMLMLLFSLPLSIPLPVPPGFTTVLSVPLILLSVQMLLGHLKPWIPVWLGKREIKRETLVKVFSVIAPLLTKMEALIRPRIDCMGGCLGEKIYAFASFLCALSIAIPLPMTNFIPAAGIAVMSLGLINRDGLAIFIGLFIALVGLFISAVVIILGPKIVMAAFRFISGFLGF